jgi:hypothetical protein
MVNSVTIVSLDRNFLVEDRFEKKFSRNKIIVPNAKMEDSDTLKIDVPMHCLVTNKVRGKALISIFPEEHYVLDFEIDCIKSEAKINESWNFGLELLQPTPTTSAEPTCITPGESTAQTFKVRPGNSCIYRVVSKTSSPHEIFPYKKPKIEQKIESNIAAAWVINSASSNQPLPLKKRSNVQLEWFRFRRRHINARQCHRTEYQLQPTRVAPYSERYIGIIPWGKL